jgi:hypothetical protein
VAYIKNYPGLVQLISVTADLVDADGEKIRNGLPTN